MLQVILGNSAGSSVSFRLTYTALRRIQDIGAASLGTGFTGPVCHRLGGAAL